MLHSIKNQFGFTLIGTIIAASIGLVIALGVTYFSTMQARSESETYQKYDLIGLQESIQETLRNSSACVNNFQAMNPNAANNMTQIVDENGSVVVSTAGTYSFGTLVFTGATFGNSSPAISSGGTGMATLAIKFELKSQGGSRQIERKIKVFVQNSGGVVAGCSSERMYTGEADFSNARMDRVTVMVPRNSTRTAVSDPTYAYDYCALAVVRTGGDEGGGGDTCRVDRIAEGKFQIYGNRGDDPAIECAMNCMDLDGKQVSIPPPPPEIPLFDGADIDPCHITGWGVCP